MDGRAEGRGSRVEGFEDLLVWQRARVLARQIYDLTAAFPRDERFGLTAQFRRAAVSIPSNIAEGHQRHTTREFIRFISDAEGSVAEAHTHIATDLQYAGSETISPLLTELGEIRRMLNGLRRSLYARIRNSRPSTLDPRP